MIFLGSCLGSRERKRERERETERHGEYMELYRGWEASSGASACIDLSQCHQAVGIRPHEQVSVDLTLNPQPFSNFHFPLSL